MIDRLVLSTLEANDLLREVNRHIDNPKLPAWKKVSDFVMMSVEYIPTLMDMFEKVDMSELPYLLWYRENDETVEEMIDKGIEVFIEKHGESPNFAMVHPLTACGAELTVRGIKVQESDFVLLNRVWLGIR